MEEFSNVKLENVRYQDGTVNVLTSGGDTYTFNIRNHFRVESDRLTDVMRCVDDWISDVYYEADNNGIDRPFNATVDTASNKVEKICVRTSGRSNLSETLCEEISSNFRRSDTVQQKP